MLTNWNKTISSLPAPHLLQSHEWATVKSKYGWEAIPVVWFEEDGRIETYLRSAVAAIDEEPAAAALLLQRKMPSLCIPFLGMGLSVMYAPKGPLLRDWGNQALRRRVLHDLEDIAHREGAIFIKIDPDVVLGTGLPASEEAQENPLGSQIREEWQASGWQFSPDQIQYRNTVLVDLTADEEDILMRMKPKTRYNIRLAGSKGVTVRVGDRADLRALYQMYADTSLRGGFAIRGEAYYQTVWDAFMPPSGGDGLHPGDIPTIDPVAAPLIAEVEGEPVAGAVIFRFGDRAWYLHGMSSTLHRKKMPTHLVQWEAMRWAKAAGCTVYDMWGAPDVFEKSDPMWGVYRFKRGYGGQVSRTIGAWDLALRPGLYKLYTSILPKVLDVMRRFGKKKVVHTTDR